MKTSVTLRSWVEPLLPDTQIKASVRWSGDATRPMIQQVLPLQALCLLPEDLTGVVMTGKQPFGRWLWDGHHIMDRTGLTTLILEPVTE